MGKNPRIGLLLGAASCLVAVMIDWIIQELTHHKPVTAASAPRILPAGTATAAATSA